MKYWVNLAAWMILTLFCASVWSTDKTIVSMQAGACLLGVEADEEWHSLRLRAHHPEYQGCTITQDQVVSILSAAIAKIKTGEYSSLFIGRLIDYPWMSRYLAETASRDAGWNSKKGKPVMPGDNLYVSRVLYNQQLLEPLQNTLAKAGYRIVGVTSEKVLIGGFRELPLYQGANRRGFIPYDAQVWLRVRKEKSNLNN